MDNLFYEELLYIELIYNEVISNMALFLSKLGLSSDETRINVIIKYMIQNGYLTNNQVLCGSNYLSTDKMENQFFRLDNAGLLVPYGSSICRHIANFLFSVYSFLGYRSSQLFVYCPSISVDFSASKNISFEKIQNVLNSLLADYDLEGEYDFETIITRDDITFDIAYQGIDDVSRLYGNHVLNLVVDRKGQIHLFDSIKNFVGTKDDDKRVIKMYQGSDFYLKWYLRDLYYSSFEDTHGKFNNAMWLFDSFPVADLKSDMRKIRMYEQECLKLIPEFEQFKRENGENYDGIAHSVDKLIRSLEK